MKLSRRQKRILKRKLKRIAVDAVAVIVGAGMFVGLFIAWANEPMPDWSEYIEENHIGMVQVEGSGTWLTQEEYEQMCKERDAYKAAEQAEQVSENDVPVVASEYADIAIAQVDNYVNVRSEPNTDSEVLGKLYNNSAATVLETTEDGWYKITSGSVTGYVKCEYVVTGDEELAKKVSTRYATVTTTTLYVRMEPSTEAGILTMLGEGDDFVVVDDSMKDSGWVIVTTEEGDGYVSTDYVNLWTDYVTAESKAEEEARLAKEEAERKAAEEAARKAEEKARKAEEAKAAKAAAKKSSKSSSKSSSSSSSEKSYSAPSGSNGQAVVNYASQFVGNPYVYGGSSLTNGTDCSGFVMSVYAQFGISLPHSSSAMRSVGYGVSTSDMQPGDIICYSGHVAIYMGNNKIVHASNSAPYPRGGIKISNVNYRTPICARRIIG